MSVSSHLNFGFSEFLHFFKAEIYKKKEKKNSEPLQLDWLNSRGNAGKMTHFPQDPAGNARKNSNVKVANFLQNVWGSKLKIFWKEWKRVQIACTTQILVGFKKYTKLHIKKIQFLTNLGSIFAQNDAKICSFFPHFPAAHFLREFPRKYNSRSRGKCGNPASLLTIVKIAVLVPLNFAKVDFT